VALRPSIDARIDRETRWLIAMLAEV